MSGLEVARLVLGIIPLAISALEHYKAGRSVVATFVKFHGQLDTLIYRLKLQRAFFYLNILDLLRNAGVSEVINKPDISEEECINILRNAKSAEEVRDYISSGHLYDTFHEILTRYETCLKAIVSKLGHIKRPPKVAKDDLKAILEKNPVGASGFAFRERLSFTIEKGSLKQLVEELSEDRLSLREMIESLKTQQVYTARDPSNGAKDLANMLSRVQRQARPLFEAMRKGCNCGCERKHKIFMRLDSRVPLKKSRERRLREQIEFSLIFDHHGYLQETHVNVHEDHLSEDYNTKITSRTVFAQKVTERHSEKTVNLICQHVSEAQAAGRILKLRLSNADLFVVDGPSENGRNFTAPITLADILKAGYQDDDAKMFPKEQTMLALKVASSILQLQQTWWLGLPFNSNGIKILSLQDKSFTAAGSFPFIEQFMGEIPQPPYVKAIESDACIGPDPKTALTELAILLLEIWHHRSLEAWCQKSGIENPTSPQGRMMVAIEWLQATSRRLLPYQSQVIEHCLQVCAGSLRFWHEREFLKMYCENIIRPLQEILGAWDTSGGAYS
ncbi:hypothetical protein A0O28_0048690 [Trichoderma guizhouense]|uniref:DUF7580 domain-containing protein n=1 Tax=Trichoderma guizhouense TaxID=1491466 RepID=A0A1T3CDF4_9HYPO|nr:hypothetical protein A0O28_0048690 [Trichoderma guizhouense]